MKRLLACIISLLLIMLSFSTKAIKHDTADFVKNIKSQSIELKMNGMISLAYYHKYMSGNHKLADSLSKEALLVAHLHELNSFICYTALVYSELCQAENFQNALNYLNEGKEIATRINNSEFNYLLLIHESNLYISNGQFKKARESLQKAVNYFESNKKYKSYYYLTLGDLQSKDNEKINCFENYNKAIYNSKDLENDSLLIQCYIKMYEFYLLNNNVAKAKENLSLASEIVNKLKNKDKSDSLMIKANLIEIYTRENKDDFALKLAEELLQFASDNGYFNIKDRVFGTIRKFYLSNNKYKEICDLYCVKYPQELERLKRNDLTVFFRVKALIFENQQNID